MVLVCRVNPIRPSAIYEGSEVFSARFWIFCKLTKSCKLIKRNWELSNRMRAKRGDRNESLSTRLLLWLLIDPEQNNFKHNKEVFVKHEQAPTAPTLEGVWVFIDLKYISYENRYFWPIWQLPVGCFWLKWSKGTSTDQDLSFEPIIKSLGPSVQKF